MTATIGTVEQGRFDVSLVSLHPLSIAEGNRLLVLFEHGLGPINRPFAQLGYGLFVGDRPISVIVSASTVSATVAGYRRSEVVECARLASSERWANRVAIRLWREVCAPAWPYWPARAAVSYSLNARHGGELYRFDGWTKVADGCGSRGGGAWSRKRDATDVVVGPKSLWLYPLRQADAPAKSEPAT